MFDTPIETQRTETHAFGTWHVDKTSTPPSKFVSVEIISSDDSFPIQESQENENRVDNRHEYVSPTVINTVETIETMSDATEFSTISNSEFRNLEQFAYRNESLKYLGKPLDKFKHDMTNQDSILAKKIMEENSTIAKYSSNVDHVYEEVNALECDIMDYYEKYSPTTAKTLINTLFLPRHKICKQCANLQDSPVYSDQLIYAKKSLHAKEVRLLQQNDTLCFAYCSVDEKLDGSLFSQYSNVQHCLLVYNCLKTNASSIFYFYSPLQDVFDLKTTLQPNILISSDIKGIVNTELYHRCANNFYTRISNQGIAPMVFHIDHNNILNAIKHIGYDTDLQNWMNYRNDIFRSHSFKQDDVPDHRANRSSLLLLEPLLLMPELGSSRYRHGKNRISQSEHMKIVKIVIAYTLSFFILATITFYIVYFT